MGLSRLENFLKSVRGTILYVNPNDLDATDSIENQGNSLTRPFKTIQRALIEAARFSYQRGLNNDRFGKTTILVYPGDHIVDNRPGWIPDGTNNFRLRTGQTSDNFPPFDTVTNFDLTTADNALYKLNSIHGGVIVPRGTSIIGLDLRKTKIRPKYVPNPTNDSIETSTIFRVTGGCYFWQFSMFDADPNGQCYIDYTDNLFVPNFSHNKLTCFEYADGTNTVDINDEFQIYSTDRTDLDMYYEKVGLAYGQSSGRAIEPDYPSTGLDIEPKIDEYRIVGSTGLSVGITSIRSGDGTIPTTTITVTTASPVTGLEVDTPFRIEGIAVDGYNGQYVVTERLSDTQITYIVQNVPEVALPSPVGSTLSLTSDTVTSASPYIFNISLRSVYGMCGVLADGDKASGFKSMVIAQFTGIGLQKDDNAFVVYNSDTGTYDDNTSAENETISTNSRAVFKPAYRNFHIKCINDAFVQNVSIFAIGYAEHFVAESGGDQSVTNSNSNFGSKALVASGFRRNAFPQDDQGYITHIIPPKEISNEEISVEFNSIDVVATVGIATTNERLYLYNQTNQDAIPEHILDGYRIGARENDSLKVLISVGGTTTEYSSRIVMSNSQTSSEKSFLVNRNFVGINSIGPYSLGASPNVITLTQPHTFENGESIRVLSDSGQLPDGLKPNTVYYAITNSNASSGLTTSVNIKLAKTLNDAKSANVLNINSKGGTLTIVSRVSDKSPGDIGHPIQYDTSAGQWYIKVSTSSTDNAIRPILGSISLGAATPRTFIKRKKDNRNASDTIYRVRYVIPAQTDAVYARPPGDGFILQESNTSIGATTAEIQTYFNTGSLNNVNQQRNFRFIADANWSVSANTANVVTELPHNLSVGSQVELVNIKSTFNTSGVGNSGFNRTYSVVGITSSKQFVVGLNTNPGTFTNDTTARNTSLPYFKRKKYNNTYYIYRNQEAQKYVAGQQDGIYYLTVVNSSNSPSIAPFFDENYSQPVKELYPQINRDNPVSDPNESKSFASSALIGEVVVNDVRNSITKETISKVLSDTDVGIGITNIISGTASTHTVYTSIDHGLNRITKVNIVYGGVGYGGGSGGTYYNAKLVGFAGSTTGQHATARVAVNPSGNITDVRIMDGGSAYGIGNTLAVVGIATTTGFVGAVVQVSQIYNNVGDSIRISGVSSETYQGYNDLYRIASVPVGAAKSFTALSSRSISGYSTTGVGATLSAESFVYLTGQAIVVSGINYNNTSGIATVTTTNRHGLNVDNKVRLTGSTNSFYNGDFVVTKNIGLNSFAINVGIATTVPSVSGTIYAYRGGVTSNDGSISFANENINGRMVANYAGITTTLLYEVSNEITTEVTIRDIDKLDLKIGDYLQIDNEIVRVKTTVPNNIASTDPVYVFRGVLGTIASKHSVNSVVRRVNITPIELRRHSIIRASGHTFEYVGFGPGNYSTAFPDKQDRQISPQEELLSQSTRRDGGINFYTGMNDKGISYSGNKKLSTVTGQEEIFDTPIQTVTGEDISNQASINVINPIEGNFGRSIRVEGGSDGNAISEFNGPVVFSDKVTSTSSKGFEVNSLFLQGDADVSRKYTVGDTAPTIAGNPGDIEFNSIPKSGGNAGWIYTTDNDWKPFGWITSGADLYGVGISANSGPVGFSTLLNIVGIGLTISRDYDPISGIATVYFEGDPINTVAISSAGSFIGDANAIDFIASKDGFGFDLSFDFNPSVGIATIIFDAPVDIINFGSNILGYASPSIATTSVGTRIIYENTLNSSKTNFAVGIGAGNDSLWWSIPDSGSSFRWFGGQSEICRLSGNGDLYLYNNSTLYSNRINTAIQVSISTTTTAPISVESTIQVNNLNVQYLNGFVSSAATISNTIVRRDSSNTINGNVTHLIHNTSGSQRGEWYADIPSRLGYSPFNRAGDTCSGDAIFNGLTTIKKVSDIYTNVSTSSTTLTCNFNEGSITRTTNTNVTVIDITNVPTTDSRVLNYTVIMNAATTVSNLANIEFRINGTLLSSGGNTIRWLNNIPPAGTAAGYYFFGFSIFRVGSVWEVISVFATYA
jgi:hypothetical protein